jgi:hypothetical protein
MKKISRIGFGGTAAIVTSMALITGLNAVGTGKSALITALLLAALADNLTDSLSIHIYQESERLDEREAFIGTLSNFTRLHSRVFSSCESKKDLHSMFVDEIRRE